MQWLSQNWFYVLLLVAVVFFLATRRRMGCGMPGHGSDADAARQREAGTDVDAGGPPRRDGQAADVRAQPDRHTGHGRGGHGCC